MPHSFSPADSVVVVTGGGSGIGRALAVHAGAEGARAVVVVDRDEGEARATADRLTRAATAVFAADVTDGAAIAGIVEHVEEEIGPIDLWCSNAGVHRGEGLGQPADWEISVGVHVRAHVHAARYVVPRMVARGRGTLLVTASAAGLLSDVESAPYAVTKHAAVALAEWLSIRHDDDGIGVSCLAPQGVKTAMNSARRDGRTGFGTDYLEPDAVAAKTFEALAAGTFLILPHPEVASYEQRRAGNRERWLAGMRRLAARVSA
ncbi:SDR family NAD(P)-dependent oxidoreductase [Amycolatopsis sp. A1MSW2902]|uniref:SDR family NAD(P)-dependent oxidoreductase n=1 Tax=Amycolatopsis sp. A1MSW2902 TaxID=687413 RepID=UPI00307F9868